MSADNPWYFVDKYPNECCAETSRKGESQPCEKPAYAVAIDTEVHRFWPVCIHHARGAALVGLTEILEHRREAR